MQQNNNGLSRLKLHKLKLYYSIPIQILYNWYKLHHKFI